MTLIEHRTSVGKSQKALLVLHGRVASREDVRAAVSRLRSEENHIEARVTWESGDAIRFAAEASEKEFDVVVAGGGDGTVNEVAQGLFESRKSGASETALAILPLGTGNDFARSCAIPDDPLSALQLALTEKSRAIDVGRVGDRVFVNMATGGFGARVTAETGDLLKQLLGPGAYVASGLARLNDLGSVEVHFEGEDFAWSGPVTFFALGNSRTAGGGNLLCPDALIDDGLLDLRILPDLPSGELIDAFSNFLVEGGPFLEKWFLSAQLKSLEIRSPEEFQINLDGEPLSGPHFRIEVERGALPARLPETAPVLSASEPE